MAPLRPMTTPVDQLSVKGLMDGIQAHLDTDSGQPREIFSKYTVEQLAAEAERRAKEDPEIARIMCSRFNLAVSRARVVDIDSAKPIASIRERLKATRAQFT